MGDEVTDRANPFCFVISPIGADGSDTRQHADTVFTCIIEPACADRYSSGGICYHAERGDHKTAPGKITDQIYEDILSADLIIAVLTESNPNVYYELAIAQAAAKPVILLLEKGFDAPFDVKDQRIIYYDFDPQNIFHGVYAKQLRAAMQSVQARQTRPLVPFAPHLTPLGDPIQTVGARASEAEQDAVSMAQRADRFFWMMGYSLKGWTMNQSFVEALGSRAHYLSKGIRALIIAPENPAFEPSMKSSEIYESAAQSARVAKNAWRKLFEEMDAPNAELRLCSSKSLHYQLMISEKEAIITPYLTSRDTLRSPFIYARRESFCHEAIVEEFQFLWESAEIAGCQDQSSETSDPPLEGPRIVAE